MKSKGKSLLMVLLMVILVSCSVPSVTLPLPAQISTATAIPTPTATLTLTKTPIPTLTPSPTSTPTPTLTPLPLIVEMDLTPSSTHNVSREYLGVIINGELITDSSMDPDYTDIFVPGASYAEYIARVVFEVWWRKGEPRHFGSWIEKDFRDFMVLWSLAQQSNDPADWEKVRINDIWANDINDGLGFVQKPYDICPMCSANTPPGLRRVDKISIVFVSDQKRENVFRFNVVDYRGFGTNLDGNTLLVYFYNDSISNPKCGYCVAVYLSEIPWWLYYNRGSSVNPNALTVDKYLENFLRSSGITAK